jgi:predicted ATP-grasp superfamily ATP-dependent carboligase
MANILLNYQSGNLRYAVEELSEHNLYSWRSLGNEFSRKTVIPMHDNIIENVDIYEAERGDLAKGIYKFIQEKNIDIIFPLYNDMMFPYLYSALGFTEKQGEIMSNKEKYTELAKDLGIPVPETYTDIKKARYPIIAKPVNGTGSIGVKVLNNYSDYFFFASGEDIQYNDLGKYYIFQDFIDGLTVSAAGRIVDGEILFDCTYTIESSDLPYRAETGFILVPYLETDDILKEYVAKLIGGLKIKNCAWMADFIFSGGEFYLVDFSPRLSVSAQALIKYSAGVDYNKMVLDSILYKKKEEVELKKSVLYRYFDLPKGKYNVSYQGEKIYEELKLPAAENYLNRIDILMPYKGYAIVAGDNLKEAEDKFNYVSDNIIVTTVE